MNIIYMGTPEFAVIPLKKLIASHHNVIGVVSQPDRVKGRGKKFLPPPVKECALENGIDVTQPEAIKDNQEFLNWLREKNPEAIVVAAYGRILPKSVLDLPKHGCINIHGSILPRWRGASPIQTAILEGEKKSGISIMKMAEGLDTGDILSIEEMDIEGMYFPTVSDKLSKLGGDMIVEALDRIEEGKARYTKQNDELATYAGMISKEDGHIDFSKSNSSKIDNMIRAYEPWPGAYASLCDKVIKFKMGRPAEEPGRIIEDYISEGNEMPVPGTIIKTDNTGIYIKTCEDVFCLMELQPPGKNWMDSGSFLRGNKVEVGSVLI